MKISERKLKTESFIVLKNSPTILFNVLNLRPTNIFSSSFHVENKSRQCLTKQLQNMIKLWCDWGISTPVSVVLRLTISRLWSQNDLRAKNKGRKTCRYRTLSQSRTVSSYIFVLNCLSLSGLEIPWASSRGRKLLDSSLFLRYINTMGLPLRTISLRKRSPVILRGYPRF